MTLLVVLLHFVSKKTPSK